jgi:TRAP-type C4-dicarboxylate transport system permease small subunit
VPDDSPGILKRLERWGTAAENASLVILLTTMIVLAVGQIVLRLFFNFGFVWTDELIKLIVLWIALIASVAAARNNRHLRIDVLSHFVPEKYARFPRIIVEAFAASMCAVLAWYSWQYLQLTLEFEDTVLVDVPAWIAYLVLPLSFALMAYRFLLTFIGEVMMMFGAANSAVDSE